MSIKVTSLDVRKYPDGRKSKVPFMIVNMTMKADDGLYRSLLESKSSEFTKTFIIKDKDIGAFRETYDWSLVEEAWTYDDPLITYIDKFDVFWLRLWVSLCPLTEIAINEIRTFKETGVFPGPYRAEDSNVLIKYIESLIAFID